MSFPLSSRTSRKFTLRDVDPDDTDEHDGHIPLSSSSALVNYPLITDHPPNQGSNTSTPDSIFSKLSVTSEAGTSIAEPAPLSMDALLQGIRLKCESTEDLPAFFFDQASDHTRELKYPHDTTTAP